MPESPRLQWLFLINATVLLAHQIDAAYWHEWELFHIPGGNQVNLILNLPIIALVLVAHRAIATRGRGALAFYKLLAGLGFLTVAVHTVFFLQGNEAFVQPMSVALLAATAALSSWQLVSLRVARRD